MSVNRTTKSHLQCSFPFHWIISSMPYLGISLTSPTSKLFQANYAPLLIYCKQERNRLSKFYLTWSDRTVAFKILLLPKILYTYRALPLKIPNSFFMALKRTLCAYVWQGKKSRCPYTTFSRHKQAGRMGDMQDYHAAVVLDQPRHWITLSSAKQWRDIEQYFIPFIRDQPMIIHPTISAAVEA